MPLTSHDYLTQQVHFEFHHCHVMPNLLTNANLLTRRIPNFTTIRSGLIYQPCAFLILTLSSHASIKCIPNLITVRACLIYQLGTFLILTLSSDAQFINHAHS